MDRRTRARTSSPMLWLATGKWEVESKFATLSMAATATKAKAVNGIVALNPGGNAEQYTVKSE